MGSKQRGPWGIKGGLDMPYPSPSPGVGQGGSASATSACPQSLQELKEVGKEQSRLEAEHPANATKNRYPHVLPCECWEQASGHGQWARAWPG